MTLPFDQATERYFTPPEVDEDKDWMWLVKTDRADFCVTVLGKWTAAEAAKKLQELFQHLRLSIIAMTPRKRFNGPDAQRGTILQDREESLGYKFLAGQKFWEICGREVEFHAEVALLKKQFQAEIANLRKARNSGPYHTCTEDNPCCERRGQYNGYGYGSGPLEFVCPKHCGCHD